VKQTHILGLAGLALLAGSWLGSADLRDLPSQRRHSLGRKMSGETEASRSRSTLVGGRHTENQLGHLLSALRESDLLKRRAETYQALREITLADLPGLMEVAEKLPPRFRRLLVIALLERWFELDVTSARDWVVSHSPDEEMLVAWAHHDPASALADACSGKRVKWKVNAISAAVGELAGPNPWDQIAMLRQLPPGEVRDLASWIRIAMWSEKDPAAAYAFANSLEPGRLRDMARNYLLGRWAYTDPLQAMARMSELVPELQAGLLGSIYINQITGMAAKKDLEAALNFVGQLPDEFRSNASMALACEWVKSDATAALEWCRSEGVDIAQYYRLNTRGTSDGSILSQAMLANSKAVLEWVEASSPGADRDRLLEIYLRLGLQKHESHLTGESGSELLMRLYNQLPPEAQERSAYEIGKAGEDGLDGINAITSTFEPGPARIAAISGFVEKLSFAETAGLDVLIASLNPGPEADAALSGMVAGLQQKFPAIAAEKAMEIRDSDLKRRALDRVMSSWLRGDPSASRHWLDQASGIPEEWMREWTDESKQADR
jgi:hypothetical protein